MIELGVCVPLLWFFAAHGHFDLAVNTMAVVFGLSLVTTALYAGALGWSRRWFELTVMVIFCVVLGFRRRTANDQIDTVVLTPGMGGAVVGATILPWARRTLLLSDVWRWCP
jgi:hypothetical protein